MAIARQGDHGPSWDDVGSLLRLVERTSHVHIEVHSKVVWDAAKRREKWTWVLEATRSGRAGRGEAPVRVWGNFPSVGVRTVPALLYRLVTEVDHALEQQEAQAEQLAAF